ncbi:PaaI family thioesterase [Cytobacillus firmus]|uniref:PaaI family thioesterase n=1 Tax=Cytobacillus firmus TaxID=1399 RepID=UPI00222820D4|nr:PaaI family thioesterase [Cytobacillus firmus]
MNDYTTSSYLQWLKSEFEASPFWGHMGITFERLEPGEVIIKMPVKKELLNSNSVMHGGAIASILDSIIGATIRSTREVRVATISLTTQFVAPFTEGTLFASATIINPGKRIQYVESKAMNDEGEIIGTALGTFAVLK